MRRFLFVLALLVLVAPLVACCGTEPTLELRSPLWPSSRAVQPTLVPTGYAIPAPAQPAYSAVPQYAPAPAPTYTPGYQYAAPPVPQAPVCR